MSSKTKEIKTKLWDQVFTDNSVDATIEIRENSIDIRLDGYGTKEEVDDCATPIMIELYDGCLQIVVWDDINEGDPKIIKMDSALISNRKE